MQLLSVLLVCVALISIEKGSEAVDVDYQASLMNQKLSSVMAPISECSSDLFYRRCILVAPKIDFLLVLDSSGSITLEYFEVIKKAAKIIVDYIHNKAPIGYYKSRVGLIEYSVYAHFEFKFNEYNTPAEIKDRIQRVKYDNGWRTATASSLSLAIRYLLEHSRSGYIKVVWVITDGQSNYGGNPKIPADQLKAMGVTVCVVAVGPYINWQEIRDIASPGCIFAADSFAEAFDIIRKAYYLSLTTTTLSPTSSTTLSPTLSPGFFSGLGNLFG